MEFQITNVFSTLNSQIEDHIHPIAIFMNSRFYKISNKQHIKNTALEGVAAAQSHGRVQLFVTPWTAACQASLSITNSQSLRKLMSIKSVMPSNHLILCRPLLLPPSIFPSIRVFSELALCIRWPKYWSFSFSTSPSNEYLISFRIDWFDLLAVQGILKSLQPIQKHQFFSALSLLYGPPLTSTTEKP